MEKRIIIVQSDESTENAQKVQIHIEADRASALELLALGTRSIMETLSISLRTECFLGLAGTCCHA